MVVGAGVAIAAGHEAVRVAAAAAAALAAAVMVAAAAEEEELSLLPLSLSVTLMPVRPMPPRARCATRPLSNPMLLVLCECGHARG